MRLDFTPIHAVIGKSFIKMKLPEQLEFDCTLKSNVGLKNAPECIEVAFNEIDFLNPFTNDTYTGSIPLQITFRNRELPDSNRMIRGIMIETWVSLESGDYLVDRLDNPL